MTHPTELQSVNDADNVIESSYGDFDPAVTMLDAFGRCPCCGTDFSAYSGLYHCLRCSEGE